MSITRRDKWKTLAQTSITPHRYNNDVEVAYSQAPNGNKVLTFFKTDYNREKQHIGFSADDETIQNLLEFLHGEVKKEFEIRPPEWANGMVNDEVMFVKEFAINNFLSRHLGAQFETDDEKMVVSVFKKFYSLLGFEKIIEIRREYPDATCIKDGKEIEVEFEYRSVNFKYHKHDTEKCDCIVCWLNDWTDSPLEVISIRDTLLKTVEFNLTIKGQPLEDYIELEESP